MNYPKNTENICRICLDENVVLNWNNMLFDYYGITYKECYYKYTQLECNDHDIFSSMLCQNCLIGLQNIHTLILRAIESHKYFEETNLIYLEIEEDTCQDEIDIKCNPTEFETVLIDEQTIDDPNEQQLNENSQKDFDKSRRDRRKNLKSIDSESTDDQSIAALKINLPNNCKHENKDKPEDSKTTKLKNKKDRVKQKIICSVCSREFASKFIAKKHEVTHAKNRERKETCEICGLKLYTRNSLLQHLEIHDKNRVKTHKCEYCPKAFYRKGGLNIHRRIHLGQMIACNICSKEFFRSHDLNQHMASHSTISINAQIRKRSKYYVHCKDCDKNILSTSYKSHKAAHLKTPLVKCSLCNNEYYSRSSCCVHLKRIHKKRQEEFDDCIIVYKKDRISRLYIEQNEDIEPAD
ncbi:zinc finger protein 846-like isoform X2 [Lucilia sericata]|uniref:zinc finger protein 846-like isoform X2 n=1 Tax=Lucilia sericata TaxID=13632 RepID=UPI0018A85A93|nr:zinc finger protein 846-like isoform X2 [Lucilia sericata]